MIRLLILGLAAALLPACDRSSSSGGVSSDAPPGMIASVDVRSVPVGSDFTITGTDMTGTSVVRIGGVDQVFAVINDTTIMVTVVNDTTPLGAQDLVIGSGGPLSDPLSITVVANLSDDGVSVTSEWEQITFPGSGAKPHHYFGYIGHGLTMPWNQSGRYILCLRVASYTRNPNKGETADVCIIDTQNDYEVIKLDETRAWNMQQGTMFNWNPAAPETQFFFNDSADGGATWTVLYDISDVSTGGTGERIMEYKFDGLNGNPPNAVANGGVAPDGSYFVGINYGRLTIRTGTMIAYKDSVYDPAPGNAPSNDGIWKVDIATGKATLIAGFDELDALYSPRDRIYVHHTLVNRLSNRITFITRGQSGGFSQASVVDVGESNNLRPVAAAEPYHPEWYEGTTIADPGDNGKYQVHDVDTQANVPNTFVGVNGTFSGMTNDNAYGPLGKWFTCSRKPGESWVYQCFRISDGYKLVPDASTGLTAPRPTRDTRIDGAPRWNRLGNELLVGGVIDGTRQLAIIRLVPGP